MIRRLPAPEKYNKQLMDLINRSPTLPYTTGGPYVSPLVYKPLRRPATTEPDTQTFGSEATTQQPQLQTQQSEASAGLPPRLAIADSPMATAPTSCHTRSSLPSPKRTVLDEVAEGSLPKQHRTTATPTGPARPDTTTEPPKSKLRITQVTTQTKGSKSQHTPVMTSQNDKQRRFFWNQWSTTRKALTNKRPLKE